MGPNENLESPMVFDLTPRQVEVRINDKEYILREVSGAGAVKWRNASAACAQFAQDGKLAQITGIGDLEPLLVSLCLFERVKMGAKIVERPVPIQVIRGWTGRVQRALFDRAKSISNLAEEGEESWEVIEARIQRDRSKLLAMAKRDNETKTDSGEVLESEDGSGDMASANDTEATAEGNGRQGTSPRASTAPGSA